MKTGLHFFARFLQLLMHSEGDVVRFSDLDDPSSGRVSRLLRTVINLMVQQSLKPGEILETKLVIVPLLKVNFLFS